MTELRIKEVAKHRGFTLQELSAKIGIDYTSLYRRLNNPKFDTLEKISDALKCEITELIPAGDNYSHFYDDKTGEWLGIRKI